MDGGFSLIELSVVTVLIGLLGSLICTLVISTIRSEAGSRSRLADVDQVRVGMDAMTRTLRTAIAPGQLGAGCAGCDVAFKEIGGRKVHFWANLNDTSRPTLLTYELVVTGTTARLVETTQPPDGTSGTASSWTGPATTRTLITGIVVPTEPIFTYTDSTGTTTAALGSVYAVDISLPVRTKTPFATGTTSARTKVFLPNSAWGR